MSDTGDTTEIIEGDRQAIQARQTSGVSHGTKLLGFALAAGFIGMMGYSVVKGEQTAAEEKSADANAAETAEQAAKTVVSDPLGNPVLPAGSGGGASMQGGAQGSSGTAYVAGAAPGTVPPIESDPEFRSGGVEPRVSRVELEQRRRDEARARALARRNEMWQSPIMA